MIIHDTTVYVYVMYIYIYICTHVYTYIYNIHKYILKLDYEPTYNRGPHAFEANKYMI